MDYLALGIGTGLLLGVVLMFVTSVLPLTRMIARMRYDGFRPDLPSARPKTVPPPPESIGD